MGSNGVLSHRELIKRAGGPAAIAREIGLDGETTKAWSRTDSISADYWWSIHNKGLATLEELAAARAIWAAIRHKDVEITNVHASVADKRTLNGTAK